MSFLNQVCYNHNRFHCKVKKKDTDPYPTLTSTVGFEVCYFLLPHNDPHKWYNLLIQSSITFSPSFSSAASWCRKVVRISKALLRRFGFFAWLCCALGASALTTPSACLTTSPTAGSPSQGHSSSYSCTALHSTDLPSAGRRQCRKCTVPAAAQESARMQINNLNSHSCKAKQFSSGICLLFPIWKALGRFSVWNSYSDWVLRRLRCIWLVFIPRKAEKHMR